MKTYISKENEVMSWQDVKDWLDSMNEQELAQAAFVYRDWLVMPDGNHTNQEAIIATTTRGFKSPRLVGQTFKGN